MKITLLLFANLRDIAESDRLTIDSEEPVSCEKVIQDLAERYPDSAQLLPKCALAKNGTFVKKDELLVNGDELAILPPVSGG